MSLSQELDKLDELHRRGVLSDAEFAQAKASVLGQAAPAGPGRGARALNRLERSRSDRWLGGVCGGLAELTGTASWIWRLLFALSVLCAGTGVAIYALLWIFVPEVQAPLAPGRQEFA